MDLGLSNKTAVVMAGSAGLGLAVVEALLAEGARVATFGRDPGRLGAQLARLDALHEGRIFGESLDAANADALDEFLRKVREQWGSIDILVTNAGGPPPKTADALLEEEIDQAYALTLKSAIQAARTVAPWMRQRRFGRIIAMSSVSAAEPVAGLALSNTMRAGLAAYMKTLATELAPFNVLVNTILTGFFATDRLTGIMADRAKKSQRTVEDERIAAASEIPVKRFGEPAEFGAFVAFLASERASYLTGAAIALDGGFTRGVY